MCLLLVPETRAHCSRWSLPQDHGLCCWCDRVSCVCTETQSMRQCLSRSFVLSKIKCEWRSSSHRLALGCAKPFGVFVEEVSQRHVCFFTRETVGLLDIPESRRRRSFILTSFVEIVDHSGCPDLFWLFDLTSIAHRQSVLSESSWAQLTCSCTSSLCFPGLGSGTGQYLGVWM